jgi:hypothetical protein
LFAIVAIAVHVHRLLFIHEDHDALQHSCKGLDY